MRGKLGSIFLGFILTVFVIATITASYFGATTHADNKVCSTQVYILNVVDDLAQTARVLVQNDKNLDPAIKQAFTNRYLLRHRQIVKRIQGSGCAVSIQDSRKQ